MQAKAQDLIAPRRFSARVLEATGLHILYEMSLDGRLLRAFPPPDDPGRFVGLPGRKFSLSGGIALVHESNRLSRIHVSAQGDDGKLNAILELDADGRYTGISHSASGIGGYVTGLVRRPYPDPRSGKEVEAYICVSNRPWITVIDGAARGFLGPSALHCKEDGGQAVVSWTRAQVYDFIEIRSGVETVATLAGDADGWQGTLPTGSHEVAVHAFLGFDEARLGPCRVDLGYGEILRSVAIEAERADDITSDGEGTLIVSDSGSRRLLRFDLALQPLGQAAISDRFVAPGDSIAGIAGGQKPGTVFVHNATRGVIGEVSFSGDLIREFQLDLLNASTAVSGMAYSRNEASGEESLWLLDGRNRTLSEVTLDGFLVRQIPHPYARIDGGGEECSWESTNGVSMVDGSDGRELFLGGHTASNRWPVTLFRFDVESGEIAGGSEIFTEHLERNGFSLLPAIQHLETPDGPRLYVLSRHERRIYELDAGPPPVRPPSFLTCSQVDRKRRIELTFENNGPFERIEVFRDNERIASIDGAADRYIDDGASPGIRVYAVRGGDRERMERVHPLRGPSGDRSDPRAETLLSLGASDSAHPRPHRWRILRPRSPLDLDLSPQDPRIRSGLRVHPEHRHRGDAAVVDLCAGDAGRAGRRAGPLLHHPDPEREGQPIHFIRHPFRGSPLPGIEIFPPRRSGYFIQPTGLAWDEKTDTFYYQEYNSDTFVQMDPDGRTIRTFPNPSPPLDFRVQDRGLALEPDRRTLLFTTADPGSQRVTKALEMRLDGTLTGFQVPLPLLGSRYPDKQILGITFVGGDLVAVGSSPGGGVFLRLLVFSDDSSRSGFRRGDPNGDGEVDISDSVHLLDFLFLGGGRPVCFDAADIDDSGELDITDPVSLLGYLFIGDQPPPPPGPETCGPDPTGDLQGADFGCTYSPAFCR